MSNIISFFQKLIKGGVGIRAGGWKIFQKFISGGDDYSVLESRCENVICHIARLLESEIRNFLGQRILRLILVHDT